MERQDSYRHVDAEAEKRLVRKMDWRIPPLVAALCNLPLDVPIPLH